MLQERQLHQLASIRTTPHATLSLYLALDQPRDQRLLAWGDLIKRKEQQMSGNGGAAVWSALGEDVQKMAKLVEELPASTGRGLAVFACGPTGLFETLSLDVPVSNLLETGPAPYIRPLAALAGDLGETLAILLDGKRARFFKCFLGSADEVPEAEILGEAGPSLEGGSQGRTGDSHLSRKSDQARTRYLKEVAAQARGLMESAGYEHLVLGGSRAAVEDIKEQLHPYLEQRLAGEFVLDVGAGASQVAQEVGQALQEARRVRQEALLANLADNLGPGGQAATGLNQVLGALFEGKVHTLFVRRGLTAHGGSCPSCGRLRHVAGMCPICNQAMTPVDDVVNLAVAGALVGGARLEQIEGDSPLDELGGVAALLRYA
jgi:peptide subunit release factor 1 (eRF1)